MHWALESLMYIPHKPPLESGHGSCTRRDEAHLQTESGTAFTRDASFGPRLHLTPLNSLHLLIGGHAGEYLTISEKLATLINLRGNWTGVWRGGASSLQHPSYMDLQLPRGSFSRDQSATA